MVAKQLFGGLGFNFANPALLGRIVLFIGFAGRMTAYAFPQTDIDALASATPLVAGQQHGRQGHAVASCCWAPTAAYWARPAPWRLFWAAFT